MMYASALIGAVVGALFGFFGGFIFHATRWPLSEEAGAVEAGIWRKRAHTAEAKLRAIHKDSE
jgi:hypothetical protein